MNKNEKKSHKVALCLLCSSIAFGCVGYVIPWLLKMYLPLFLPKVDLSSLNSFLDQSAIVLSFISVVLGGCSIYQAYAGAKQMNQALTQIESLSDHIANVERTQQSLVTAIQVANRTGQSSADGISVKEVEKQPHSPPDESKEKTEIPGWDKPAKDEDTNQ